MSDREVITLSILGESIGIETLFSQLCDQHMLKRNYAKTKTGIAIRLLCKITSVTMLQYINYLNNKPLNHLKYALVS